MSRAESLQTEFTSRLGARHQVAIKSSQTLLRYCANVEFGAICRIQTQGIPYPVDLIIKRTQGHPVAP
jgi:hypothetical protein